MDMSRVRKVAVRMRPKSPDQNAVPPADTRNDVAPPEPRRVAISAPRSPSGRNIWDLPDDSNSLGEQGDLEQEPGLGSSDQDPLVLTQPEPGTARPGRAKTRILGFGAQQLATTDPTTQEARASGPVFPAGFLVVVEGPGRGAFFAVTTQVSSIGRSADQDIALDFGDESISRSGHASVMYDAEQARFFIGHGNKANAVRRNGTPVLTTEEIAHGDRIRIGKTTLRFHAFCDADFSWDTSNTGENAYD